MNLSMPNIISKQTRGIRKSFSFPECDSLKADAARIVATESLLNI